jgi:hypothetical protein
MSQFGSDFNGVGTPLTSGRSVPQFSRPIVTFFISGLSKYLETAVSFHQNVTGGKEAHDLFLRLHFRCNRWSWPAATYW